MGIRLFFSGPKFIRQPDNNVIGVPFCHQHHQWQPLLVKERIKSSREGVELSRELPKFGISKERVQPEEEDDDDRATRTAEEIKGKVGIILFCVCVSVGGIQQTNHHLIQNRFRTCLPVLAFTAFHLLGLLFFCFYFSSTQPLLPPLFWSVHMTVPVIMRNYWGGDRLAGGRQAGRQQRRILNKLECIE